MLSNTDKYKVNIKKISSTNFYHTDKFVTARRAALFKQGFTLTSPFIKIFCKTEYNPFDTR